MPKAGDLPGAIRDYENLLPDLVRVLGRDNPGTLDIGTAVSANADDRRGTIADYERRAQELLDRVKATYARLLKKHRVSRQVCCEIPCVASSGSIARNSSCDNPFT